MTNDKWTESVRHSLNNYEAPIPPQGWERLKRHYHPSSGTPAAVPAHPRLWRAMAVAAAVAVLVAMGGAWLISGNQTALTPQPPQSPMLLAHNEADNEKRDTIPPVEHAVADAPVAQAKQPAAPTKEKPQIVPIQNQELQRAETPTVPTTRIPQRKEEASFVYTKGTIQYVTHPAAQQVTLQREPHEATTRSLTDDCFAPEHIKSQLMKVAQWQLQHPVHADTDWTNGAFLTGLYAAYKATRSDALLNALLAHGNRAGWQLGKRLWHADDIVIGQTYLDLYRETGRKEMLEASVQGIRAHLAEPYPVKGREVIKWWWCDALFMAPPAIAKCAAITGDKRMLKQGDRLFMECYNLLYNKEERLFARDYDFVATDLKNPREANGRLIFWGRGNAWVIAGLARMLQELPADYPTRAFYLSLYREMAARLVELQRPDGLWRASLLNPDAYPGGEGSASGFICYALAWGVNNGMLDTGLYAQAARKAWQGLETLVADDGAINYVQPIGFAPDQNIERDSHEAYGAGAYLLAGSEMLKLAE